MFGLAKYALLGEVINVMWDWIRVLVLSDWRDSHHWLWLCYL